MLKYSLILSMVVTAMASMDQVKFMGTVDDKRRITDKRNFGQQAMYFDFSDDPVKIKWQNKNGRRVEEIGSIISVGILGKEDHEYDCSNILYLKFTTLNGNEVFLHIPERTSYRATTLFGWISWGVEYNAQIERFREVFGTYYRINEHNVHFERKAEKNLPTQEQKNALEERLSKYDVWIESKTLSLQHVVLDKNQVHQDPKSKLWTKHSFVFDFIGNHKHCKVTHLSRGGGKPHPTHEGKIEDIKFVKKEEGFLTPARFQDWGSFYHQEEHLLSFWITNDSGSIKIEIQDRKEAEAFVDIYYRYHVILNSKTLTFPADEVLDFETDASGKVTTVNNDSRVTVGWAVTKVTGPGKVLARWSGTDREFLGQIKSKSEESREIIFTTDSKQTKEMEELWNRWVSLRKSDDALNVKRIYRWR